LQQDWDARVLVVDNCADEPVAERVGVEVVRSPRRMTLGAARNLGLAAVTTEAVMFWDADDLMLPGALGRLEAIFDQSDDAVAVTAAILEAPGVPHHWPRPMSRSLSRWPRLFAIAHLIASQFPTTGCVLLRTDAVRDGGGFPDIQQGADWRIGAALAFRGRVVFDPRPGRMYRRHLGSISALRTPRSNARNARALRRQVREDERVPRLLRRTTRLLAPAQLLSIYLLGPLARRIRVLLRSRATPLS
jgi:glycosyltransferase involved in cell wall biosynthesis